VLLNAAVDGQLSHTSARWHGEAALTVVMAAKGYPGTPARGGVIEGFENVPGGVEIFHAGTAEKDGKIIANGGRVLSMTATGASVTDAQARAYAGVDAIDWPDGFCRRDIGYRAVERERIG
jgi:phosphoribosylamine--glycine ligase